MPILKKILLNISRLNRRAGLLKRGDSVLIAVSGGPDSMALLHLMNLLKRGLRLDLAVAHVHHGLRKQNDRALDLVRKASAELGLPFYFMKADARKFAKSEKRSLEEAGRILRYSFFEKTALGLGMNKIATAHTLDDQAETLLMRIARGCGLRGLTGIRPVRRQGKSMVIRPLLMCAKSDLLSHLKYEKIPFLVDRSNFSEAFTRNRIRAKLLPWLEQNLNVAVKDALFDLQDSCERAQTHLEALAEKKFSALSTKKRKKAVGVPVESLRRLDPAVLSEVLRHLYAQVRGDCNAIMAVHRFGMEELLGSSHGSGRLDLPGSMQARREGPWLWIEKKRPRSIDSQKKGGYNPNSTMF